MDFLEASFIDWGVRAGAMILAGLLAWYARKNDQAGKFAKAALVAAEVFQVIEKYYKVWNIAGGEKMQRFVQEFILKFSSQFHEVPDEEVVEFAKELAEKSVEGQKK